MTHYDIAVIGFGKAGKTLAAAAGRAGFKTALIEANPDMAGGSCINVACIPTKCLVEKAKVAARHGKDRAPSFYPAAIEAKRRLVGMLREKNLAKLKATPNTEVIFARASFLDAKTLKIVDLDGKESTLTADRIYVNTGSRPTVPSIPGLKLSETVVTSEGLLDRDELPQRLMILGGSFIGLEFASIYADFGADVTVILRGESILPNEEPEVARAIREKLEKDGVTFLTRSELQSVSQRKGGNLLSIRNRATEAEKTYECEVLLVATGRSPATDGLDAQKAGLLLGKKGEIVVNSKLETSVPGIFAMGDVTGAEQFTYLSLDDFRIAESALKGNETHTRHKRPVYPKTLFVDPPFSKAGLTEAEAVREGHRVKTALMPAAAIPKAHILGETTGVLKAVVDAESDRLLGVSLFCAESHEMIGLLTSAIATKADWRLIRDAIYAHPTMTEGLNDLFGMMED